MSHNVESSSSVDIASLIRTAEEIDAIAAANPDPVRAARKPRAAGSTGPARKPATATAPAQATVTDEAGKSVKVDVQPPPRPEMPPQFPLMFERLAGAGTDYMKAKKGWTDPGLIWKKEVGKALAEIIHYYIPVGSRGAPFVILVSYMAMYVTANMVFPATSAPKEIASTSGGQ